MDSVQFSHMGLDERLSKAIANLGWHTPTLIQEKAIPLILEGKDILAKARTGSGKTGAFSIPIINNILDKNLQAKGKHFVYALILAPTKELCRQLEKDICNLTLFCSREMKVINISPKDEVKAQKSLLNDGSDIVVGTPSRVLSMLKNQDLVLSSLKIAVLDECDLMFTFGYRDDTLELFKHLPKSMQCIMTSATMNPEVTELKKIVLHNPVILKLEEPDLPSPEQLSHFYVKAEEEDKFVMIYSLFKLSLISGRSIIFVNTVDRCYKIKLFLEQFGINSAILNCELPVNSRCHIIQQFNQGAFDIIIASDLNSEDMNMSNRRRSKDKESGASRGIDFQFVSNVISFDLPSDLDTYIHRVGRTARGRNKGAALSFVSRAELTNFHLIRQQLKLLFPAEVKIFKKFKFSMDEVESFRYRARDAWRAVTKIAIREARLQEIRKEIISSQKLKSYFDDHAHEAELLKHDRALHTVRHQPHLKHVPEYIIPDALKSIVKIKQARKKSKIKKNKVSAGKLKYEKRLKDPLKGVMK